MQAVLSAAEHSCKLSYGWSGAEVLIIEAFSHITGVRAPVTGSQSCPDGRREFIFFPKSLAQVGTPSCCSGAKGNKPPKNGYGGKFSLIRGEAYKNKADGERERGKRLFSTLSQRCLNRTHAHIQNHSGDSYLLVPEFKAAEVRQPNIIAIAYSNTRPLLALSIVLS